MANLSNINGKFVVEQTTGYVGVGTTNPSYLLHMSSADIPNGTRLVIENTNASGKEYGLIADNTGVFSIRDLTAGADRLSISSSGNSTFAGSITGTTASFTRLDINASNTKLKGDLLGNADAAYDIGASGANRPRNLYLSNSINAGDITTTGVGNFGGSVTITGNLFLPTASSYIKLGGYSYIGEDLTDQDSLTIASDSTESIYFAHFNQSSSTYTTTAEIDNDGNFTVGNVTYGSSLGQVRIINDAATAPASLSLFGYNNIPDQGIYASIDMAMQLSGTGGQVAASIKGVADGIAENTSDIAFHTASGGTLSEKMRIGYNGQIGIGASTNLDGRLDLRMVFVGQNWVPDGTSAKWSEVWCNTGTPGTYFNDTMLHIDTNRGGGATGGVVGIAFSPGWQGHQNWGIYSYNTTGTSFTSGDLSFVSQINTGDRFERMRLNGVNGCVGIGIDTTPNSNVKLRVVGDFSGEWTAEVKSTNTTGQAYGLVVNTLAGAGVYNLGCYTHTGNGFFVQNDGKVAIGTGAATQGRLHVTQGYSAALRTGYFQSSAYSAPHVTYDSFAINQQDVPSLILVETPAAATSSHQKLTITVGDNNAVIRTSQVSGGMWFNVNGDISEPGYKTGIGTNALRLLNNGDAILPGKVGIGVTSPSAKLTVISSGADGIQLGSDTSSTGNSGRIFWSNTSGGWAMMALGEVLSIRSSAVPGSTSGNPRVQLTNYSSTAWTASSDESLKENINSIGNVLDKINDYRCIEYNLIDDEDKNKKIGFIAQDWQEDFPQIVEQMEDEKIGMKYTETIPILLKAIQELKAEIELLKNK